MGARPLRAIAGVGGIVYIYYITWCVFTWTFVKNHTEVLVGDTGLMYTFFRYEADIFFAWLLSSASFLLFVNLTKFNVVWNDFKGTYCDKYIWNNKHTQDSLNYFQWENQIWSLNGSILFLYLRNLPNIF